MIFVIVAIGMIGVAAACLAVPLWRARLRSHLSADNANRAIREARREELESDLISGRLAQADYDAALRDIDQELAATLDTAQREGTRAAKTHGNRLAAGIVVALIVAASGILYWQLGNWRAGVEGVRQASVTSVEQMVAQLSQRLHTTDPKDLQGWEMLGHAYFLMGRYQDAADAYARARSLSADGNAGVLAGYGEAVAMADPNEFMSKAMPAFEKALELDPSNPQALWYGGLGALENGKQQVAVARWNALLAQHPPAEYQAIIEKAITAAGGKVQPKGLAADPVADTAHDGIQVDVTLDPRLRPKVAPNETVYLFAEPADGKTGPPLAVKRFRVRNLPLHVTLRDSDSMRDSRKLSSFEQLVITARISASGKARAQAGDLFGKAGWSRGNSKPVKIRITSSQP